MRRTLYLFLFVLVLAIFSTGYFSPMNLLPAFIMLTDGDVGDLHQRRLSNNRPINFYGVLLNQSGTPLSYETVRYEISEYKTPLFVYLDVLFRGMDFSSATTSNETVVTDENGVFLVSGKGRSLRIHLPQSDVLSEVAGDQPVTFGYWQFPENDVSKPQPYYLVDRSIESDRASSARDFSLSLGRDKKMTAILSLEKLLRPDQNLDGSMTLSLTTGGTPDAPAKGFP